MIQLTFGTDVLRDCVDPHREHHQPPIELVRLDDEKTCDPDADPNIKKKKNRVADVGLLLGKSRSQLFADALRAYVERYSDEAVTR